MYKVYKYSATSAQEATWWEDKYALEATDLSDSLFVRQRFWPLLEAQLQEEGKYLDVGCGLGEWTLFLRRRGYEVAGVDTAAKTIAAVKQRHPEVDWQVASMTALPYPNHSFDGVLALGTLEYMEDEVESALQEIHRILQDGGFFFLEVPIMNLWRRLAYIPLKDVEGWVRQWQGRRERFAYYYFDRAELRGLLESAGFEVVAEQPHELPEADRHYGLWLDWRLLRGKGTYDLNWLGRIVRRVSEAMSPWVASTGVVIVARKK